MQSALGTQSLEARINEAGGPVSMMRSSQLGPPVPGIFPAIPSEFTSWRDEVRAWKDSVALLEQSYHMEEVHLRGRDVIAFLNGLGINKFDPFPVLRGKHLVVCAADGNLIGDTVLFHEEPDFYRAVGIPPAHNWLMFHAGRTHLDVTAEQHQNYVLRAAPRDVFRIEIQGPLAHTLVSEVAGATLPEVKFFHIGEFRIAGKPVRALRHGMAGTPGFEIYGRWDDQHAVREALEIAGEKYGLRKVGALAYSTTAQESGWLPAPLPAIYAGAAMREYREWMQGLSFEGLASLAGSLVSERIEDYYLDPLEAGYGGFIDWNRDFIGRDALKARAAQPQRRKVTLEWDNADVVDVIASSLFDAERPARFLTLPTAIHGTFQYDKVLDKGRHVGSSHWVSYTANGRKVISTAIVDADLATPGTPLTLLWGEPDARRPMVEPHVMREVRVTVAPSPYFEKIIKSGGKR